MELKWLEDFICLAKQRNFSKASQARNVTQPAFSRRIQALEAWIGVTLIDRSSYPIKLTELGAQFLPHAQNIITTSLTVRDDFHLLGNVKQNTIRLITLHTISVNWLPQWLDTLWDKFPETVIEDIPSIQGIDQHFDAILSNVVQLIIIYHHDSIMPRIDIDQELKYKTIGHDKLVPVASKSFAEVNGLKDLMTFDKEIPFLSYSNFSFSEKLVKPLSDKITNLKPCYQNALGEGLAAMVRLNRGVAWLPHHMVEKELQNGSLVLVGGDDLQVDMELRVYRSHATGSRVLEAFWSLLEEK